VTNKYIDVVHELSIADSSRCHRAMKVGKISLGGKLTLKTPLSFALQRGKAEEVGFEPTYPLRDQVFETCGIVHYPTPPD
jgi:hypothetical protein